MTFIDHNIGPSSIRLRRSSTPGDVPTSAMLRPGELAVNTADGRIFIGSDDGVKTIGEDNQIVSSGGISDLTSAQQEDIKTGTIVTTTDGKRWVYKGTGSKTQQGSYIELADITPVWSAIADKPSTFTPSAHTHAISDVTDLQTTLDGKIDEPGSPSDGDVLTWADGAGAWTAKATQIQQWDENRTYSSGDLVWHVATARIWRSEGGAPGAEPSPESGSWYAITTPADAQSLPTGVDTGHVLTFDGSAWVASPPGIPAPPSPADGDVLVWSADDAAWQAQQPSGGATYLSGVVTTDIFADGLLEQVLTLAPIVGNSTYLVEGLVVFSTMYNQQMRLYLGALDEDGQVLLDHDKATADLANARTTVRRVDQMASETVEFESSGDQVVDVPIRFRALIQTANISSTSLVLRCGDSVDGQPCDILAGSWMVATKIA